MACIGALRMPGGPPRMWSSRQMTAPNTAGGDEAGPHQIVAGLHHVDVTRACQKYRTEFLPDRCRTARHRDVLGCTDEREPDEPERHLSRRLSRQQDQPAHA